MTPAEREAHAAREGALLRRRPDLATLIVTGRDRLAWFNGVVTCDLAPLQPGGGAYGLSVGKNGKIRAELLIAVGADRLLVGVRRDLARSFAEELDRYLVMEDAELSLDDEHRWLTLHGPAALPLASEASPRHGGLAVPVTLTDLGDAAVVAPREQIDALAAALLERPACVEASEEGWLLLRVERCVPEMGVDFDQESYPQEAALERRAVSFQKGCYLGQEIVCMLELRGHVKQKLAPILVSGDGPIAAGAEVQDAGGGTVGHITSVARSDRAGGWLALGKVKYKLARPGTELSVAGRPARVAATPVA